MSVAVQDRGFDPFLNEGTAAHTVENTVGSVITHIGGMYHVILPVRPTPELGGTHVVRASGLTPEDACEKALHARDLAESKRAVDFHGPV